MSDGAPPDWDSLLGPRETLLWQGRPSQALRLSPRGLVTLAIGALVLAFGIWWLVVSLASFFTARAHGAEPALLAFLALFPLMALAVAGLGVTGSFAFPLLDRRRRRATHYALTSRRALARRDERHVALSISPETQVDFDPGRLEGLLKREPTIVLRDPDGGEADLALEMVDDAPEVLRLIRNLQSGRTA